MVRRYKDGDHLAIGQICQDAVHQLTRADYNEPQRNAWAEPGPIDPEHWRARCERKQPFVKEVDGVVAGFIELDPDGHIDCTYVAPSHARTGAMSEIMEAVKTEAGRSGVLRLYAEVSITALPFFKRHGFRTMRENLVALRGQKLVNYTMECWL